MNKFIYYKNILIFTYVEENLSYYLGRFFHIGSDARANKLWISNVVIQQGKVMFRKPEYVSKVEQEKKYFLHFSIYYCQEAHFHLMTEKELNYYILYCTLARLANVNNFFEFLTPYKKEKAKEHRESTLEAETILTGKILALLAFKGYPLFYFSFLYYFFKNITQPLKNYFKTTNILFLWLIQLLKTAPYVFLFYLSLNLHLEGVQEFTFLLIKTRFFIYGLKWLVILIQSYWIRDGHRRFIYCLVFPLRLFSGLFLIGTFFWYIQQYFPGWEFMTLWVFSTILFLVFGIISFLKTLGNVFLFPFLETKQLFSPFYVLFFTLYSFIPYLLSFLLFRFSFIYLLQCF